MNTSRHGSIGFRGPSCLWGPASRGSPGDAVILDTSTVAETLDSRQIDHELAFAAMLRQCSKDRRGVTDDQHVGVLDNSGEIVHEQRGDMWDLALDVLLVGADQPSERYRIVVDAKVKSLADKRFSQHHQRTLAQVVGAGLETDAEHSNSTPSQPNDHVDSTLDLMPIARQNGTHHREFNIRLARPIEQRAKVLRQT